MKNIISIVVIVGIFALTHTMACQDEIQEEEETMLAYSDHMPLANGGLGCMTDSECEGIDD